MALAPARGLRPVLCIPRGASWLEGGARSGRSARISAAAPSPPGRAVVLYLARSCKGYTDSRLSLRALAPPGGDPAVAPRFVYCPSGGRRRICDGHRTPRRPDRRWFLESRAGGSRRRPFRLAPPAL